MFVTINVKQFGQEQPVTVNTSQIISLQERSYKEDSWFELSFASMGAKKEYKGTVSYDLCSWRLSVEQGTILLDAIHKVSPIVDIRVKGSGSKTNKVPEGINDIDI